jgi:hypothetical protein
VLLTVILLILLKRVLSTAHQPFEFMVAGTCVTAVALVAGFVVIVRRNWL